MYNLYKYTIVRFFSEVYTFIQQECCIQLIKSDSKDFYIVTKNRYFQIIAVDVSIRQRILKKYFFIT